MSLQKIDTTWMLPDSLCWLDLENVDPMFLPGTIVSYDGKQAVTIALENGQQQLCKPQLLLERAEPILKYSNGFEDMVNMETLNDAELLQNLILRFKNDYIFTYVGPTLLVMNPFKGIKGITTEECRNLYIEHIVRNNRNYKDLEPHVYAIAAQAYKYLFENEKNQAIVISGESGAGKTENAKFAMKLLTSIASDNHQTDQPGIEEQILGCNPILEAFGNAKTVRNNNSSRFGKYVRIIVDENSRKIVGAEIINYLLEKSRINQQGKNERNFHIFYILLKGMSEEQKATLKVNVPIESFTYLNSSSTYTIPNVNDADLYEEIATSFQVLGMAQDYENILRVVFSVLHLGNVLFDSSTLTDKDPATIIDPMISEILQIDVDAIQESLTTKTRLINKQTIISPLTIEECQFARDTLAKDLFDRLFNWLVVQLNIILKPQSNSKLAVGLLDIYGFEVFDKNGFEQIMINYTNEKLHQLYIQYVFKEEEKIFIDEGLQKYCASIVFSDNTAVIELIDKSPGGIFSLLDESCQVKSSDDQLLQKIRNAQSKNPLLKNPKMPSEQVFIVVHTAKDVAYSTQGFREKNKDELSLLTQTNMTKSKNSLIQRLYSGEATKDKFITQKIKKEMNELMVELNSCDVHFIRCIKPNESKKPQELWPEMTLKQIRYLGVLDSLKVRKESYSIRRLYQAFYKKYCNITRNKLYVNLIKENPDFRQLVMDMFQQYMPQLDTKLVLFGKTRIFIRQQGIIMIEEAYAKLMEEKNKKARRLQKAFQVHKMNQSLQRLMKIAMKLRMLAIRVRLRTKKKRELRCIVFIQTWWKFKLRLIRQKKYQASSNLFQKYIKRYFNMQLVAKKKLAVNILQKFVRNIIRQKAFTKQREINTILKNIIDQGWLQIQNKKALKIQSAYKGFICRKKHKTEINKIKVAGRMVKFDSCVRLIQSNARVYLAKSYFKRAHAAAYLIQGHFRMRILSDLFLRMRESAIKIQRKAKIYIKKQMNFRKAFEQYIKPWEQNVNQQKVDAQSFWSLTNESQFEECYPLLEQCLQLWRPKLSKIALFAVPIDIDVLSDLYQCYNPNYSYARTLLNIIIQQFRKDHPIQTYLVSEESTICVTLGGTSIFEFGDGQLFLNTDNSEQVEKIIFPEFIKIKSISADDEYILITTSDGTLLQYGDHEKSIRYKPFVHQINTICTSKNYIVSENKLYSWIGVKFHLPIQHKVKYVSAGNQFAMALCEGGQLFGWGENLEGELGLGDRIYRTEPTLVNLEKILQVNCGLKHVVARARSKFYTWGWGERGQLGHGDFRNELTPKAINQCVSFVSCGRTSTNVITNERQVMWCGTNCQLSYQCKLEQIRMNISLNTMVPIRIISTYSKVVEITYITFANTMSYTESNTNRKLKILNNLINLWSESSDPQSVDPPFNQAISNVLYEASMHKPCSWNKIQIANHYRMHKEQLYIDDDREWAMRKRELVEGIRKHQKSVNLDDKMGVIKQRYLELREKDDINVEEQQFMDQIERNERLYQLIMSH